MEIISPNLTHTQLSGISKGISSSVIGASGFSALIFLSLISWAFSDFMRSNSTEAGSSVGSWGTNLPCTAYCSMLFFSSCAVIVRSPEGC